MDTKWVYKIGIHFVRTELYHFVPILDFECQKYVQNGYKMGIQNRYTFCTYKIAPFCTHFGYMRRILYPFCIQCNAILYIQNCIKAWRVCRWTTRLRRPLHQESALLGKSAFLFGKSEMFGQRRPARPWYLRRSPPYKTSTSRNWVSIWWVIPQIKELDGIFEIARQSMQFFRQSHGFCLQSLRFCWHSGVCQYSKDLNRISLRIELVNIFRIFIWTE